MAVSGEDAQTTLHKQRPSDQASGGKIFWCPVKEWNNSRFHELLSISLHSRQITNGGPLQDTLEDTLTKLTCSTKRVVPAANGTAALHALCAAWSLKLGRKLRWATQAFTFPSAVQGPLQDALVLDIDAALGGPDMAGLEQNISAFNGIIVTNVFGYQTDIPAYERWCATHGKLLVFDNAASALGFVDGRSIHDCGDGAFLSLHETKPVGRGEGGAVFVGDDLHPFVLRAMNFGFSSGPLGVCREGSRVCSNWRMSDIAAAAAISHLESVMSTNWVQRYASLVRHAIISAEKHGLGALEAGHPYTLALPTIPSCLFLHLPEAASGKVGALIQCLACLPRPIEAKQYYRPLADMAVAPRAWALFDGTICLPFHLDLSPVDVDYMLQQLRHALDSVIGRFTK